MCGHGSTPNTGEQMHMELNHRGRSRRGGRGIAVRTGVGLKVVEVIVVAGVGEGAGGCEGTADAWA